MTDKMREAFANLCKECGPTISFYDFEMGWDAAQAEQSAELERLRKCEAVLVYVRSVLPMDTWADDCRRMIDAAIAAEGEKK